MTREEILQTAKPILFDTKMVQKIQDNQKSVTRQLIKSSKVDLSNCVFVKMSVDPSELRIAKDGTEYPHDLKGLYATFESLDDGLYFPLVKAPYQIGDFLYVRETWSPLFESEMSSEIVGYRYKAETLADFNERIPPEFDWVYDSDWHPSVHMPKEAARVFLQITDIRAERLQNITPEQIEREGVWCPCNDDDERKELQRDYYKRLWNSTRKKSDLNKFGWDANNWVWVIEFKRVEATDNG